MTSRECKIWNINKQLQKLSDSLCYNYKNKVDVDLEHMQNDIKLKYWMLIDENKYDQ
jgi:hypothetical protein